MKHTSIPQLFDEIVRENPAKVAYSHKQGGRWVDVTWSEQRLMVDRISRALTAMNVRMGNSVAILAQTRLEWVQLDFGIVGCGAVTVGIYPSSLAAECAYIINHSDTEVIFVEDAKQAEKLSAVRRQLPRLREIVILDGPGDAAAGIASWDEFLARAESVTEERLEQRRSAIKSDDVASLVYTSGTTGVPKGVMITHGNLIFTTWSARQKLHIERQFVTLLFLPLAHVFARLMAFCCMARAAHVYFAEDLTKIPENLRETRPHFITSVPRVYEKAHDKIMLRVESAGGFKLALFHWAVRVGSSVAGARETGSAVSAWLRLQHALADRLVFRKIREGFGGRLAWGVSGAAPLSQPIARFFDACGVTILEGIGMTENTSFSNVNEPGSNKIGTVGRVGPGIEMKIAEDGEVLFRGANVMKGYYKNPEATAETIDADGWLHSGDIGDVDDDGYLKITDRKKDLIVTSGGKNIAPQRIEKLMQTCRFIAQVVAYGDQRKYISALVTLDPSAVGEWAIQHGLDARDEAALTASPRIRELIGREIEERNRELSSFETVKRFHILPRQFTLEDGELTPTLKLKRKVICEKYQAELDSLYS